MRTKLGPARPPYSGSSSNAEEATYVNWSRAVTPPPVIGRSEGMGGCQGVGNIPTGVSVSPITVRRERGMTDHAVSGDVGFAQESIGAWEKREVLGRGAHGVVFRGVLTSTGENIAVKQIDTCGMGADDLKVVKHEIKMVQKLRHPNIIRYRGYEQDGSHLNLFLEFIDGGNLRKRLQEEGAMSEERTAKYTQSILTALHYMHSKGITHRDIKAREIP